MHLCRKIALVGMTLTSGLITFSAAPANAVTLQQDFSVEIIDGDLFPVGETFLGSFVYDDSFLTGSGEETLSLDKGLLDLTFDFVGSDTITPVTYSAQDDTGFGIGFPQAIFNSGSPAALNYKVEIDGPDFVFEFNTNIPGGVDFISDDLRGDVALLADGELNFASTPEPGLIVGILLTVAGSALRRRQA